MTASAEALALSPTVATTAFGDLPANAIEIAGLTKIYNSKGARNVQALRGIDLAIPRGSIFGLLGPNGAGKSTTINILSGLVVKTSGTVKVWRHDIDREPRAARGAIGVVPQELLLDAFFTPREALELTAGLYGVPKSERRTDEILEAVGLKDKANAYSRSLSGGMRRRLMVAKAMVHSPPILVLDEPTAGVDVELRQQLWAHVKRINELGCTILLTTHYLEEAQSLCDRIAIISRGLVVAHDTTSALLRRLDQKSVTLTFATDPDPMPAALAELGVERIGPMRVRYRYQPSRTQLGSLLHRVADTGLEIVDLSTEESDLEDIFLELTARPADA